LGRGLGFDLGVVLWLRLCSLDFGVLGPGVWV
jgi:hypothetical protein